MSVMAFGWMSWHFQNKWFQQIHGFHIYLGVTCLRKGEKNKFFNKLLTFCYDWDSDWYFFKKLGMVLGYKFVTRFQFLAAISRLLKLNIFLLWMEKYFYVTGSCGDIVVAWIFVFIVVCCMLHMVHLGAKNSLWGEKRYVLSQWHPVIEERKMFLSFIFILLDRIPPIRY